MGLTRLNNIINGQGYLNNPVVLAKITSAVVKGATLGAKGKAGGLITKGIAVATGAKTIQAGANIIRGGSPASIESGGAAPTILELGTQDAARAEQRKKGLRSTILAGDTSSQGSGTLLGGG